MIAAGLLVFGGAAAVALGVGRAATRTSVSVDAGFTRDMAGHHPQGVEMVELALQRSADPEVRGLAFDISSTQTTRPAGCRDGSPCGACRRPVENPWRARDAGMTMDMGGSAPADSMPGMATEQELAEVRTLTGPRSTCGSCSS